MGLLDSTAVCALATAPRRFDPDWVLAGQVVAPHSPVMLEPIRTAVHDGILPAPWRYRVRLDASRWLGEDEAQRQFEGWI